MRYDSELAVRLFVDGELTAQQQNLFLAYCESDVEQYRELALALVERERTRTILQELAASDKSCTTAGAASQTEAADKGGNERVPRPRLPAMATGYLVAAALLLACTVGVLSYLVGSRQGARIATSSPDPGKVIVVSPAETQPNYASAANDALVLSDPQLRPVVMAALADKRFSEDSQYQLREIGYEVSENSSVYVFESEAGQHFVVPHREAMLQFVASDDSF